MKIIIEIVDGSVNVNIDDIMSPLEALGLIEIAKSIILGGETKPTTETENEVVEVENEEL